MADWFEISTSIEADVAAQVVAIGAAFQIAEELAKIAQSTAPVDSGAYKDSIHAEETKSGARVVASDPKSAIIEFGAPTRNLPAKFNLRRAVDAAGLKFRKKA